MAYKHTFISKNGHKTKELTAMKAIREKCLECCGWVNNEVRKCMCADCALWPFRFGKNPNKVKNGIE